MNLKRDETLCDVLQDKLNMKAPSVKYALTFENKGFLSNQI